MNTVTEPNSTPTQSASHRPSLGARRQGADLGRPALGRAPGHAALSAAAPPVPAVWHLQRAGGLCGSARPVDPPLPPADRPGLSIDADESRRAERAFLDAWDRTRRKRRPRHLGVDEIHRGKGQRYWTVLSDVVRGDVIGLAQDRSEDSLRGLLHSRLDARQRAAVHAVCTDMHRPYVNVVGAVLSRAEVVFDKFHVLQHAAAALDEVRRQKFFRAGAVMRAHGRGKRWLLLRRWKTVRGSKRKELQALFAANRRLFKAYVLREQLDRLWTYKTRPGVLNFLLGWIRALRWQRLPEMEYLGDFLFTHIEGIAAYCDHPVRFGVVESINTTIKRVIRRARGMRDEGMLLLKLKWATARPLRSARDVRRFLHPEPVHSLR